MNECAKLIGTLIGIAILGLGTWGAYAIGSALGLSGFVGLMAGGGIIAAGLIGVCVVGVAAVAICSCLRSCCGNMRRQFRHNAEERAERRRLQQVARQDTARIQQELRSARVGAIHAAVNQREYEAPPQYQQNPQLTVPANASAPPMPSYEYQPAKYGY